MIVNCSDAVRARRGQAEEEIGAGTIVTLKETVSCPKKVEYVNKLCYFRSFNFNLILDGEKPDLCNTVIECD